LRTTGVTEGLMTTASDRQREWVTEVRWQQRVAEVLERMMVVRAID